MFLTVKDLASHEPVENFTQRIYIYLRANDSGSPILQLRRSVSSCTYGFIRKGDSLTVLKEVADPKVTNDGGLTISLNKYVLRLEVSMNYSVAMGCSNTFADFPKE